MKSPSFLLASVLIPPALADFRQEKGDDSLKVFYDDTLVTEYRTDHHLPYLYPLVGPNGTSLTRHYPMKKEIPGEADDHPHHRSFWFTHGDVNGHDFWHSKDGKSSIVHRSFAETSDDSFSVKLDWQQGDQCLLKETRNYQFVELSDQAWLIIVTADLVAQTEVTFGDTKEGSFALRVTPSLRHEGEKGKGSITTSEGKTDKEAWGKPARWVSYHGPDSTGTKVAVTMMDHPENLNHPTHWHARTYGLLTANPFGEKSFTKKGDGSHQMQKGESLKQRYALLLQKGAFDKASVEKAWQSFTQ